ncbi:Transcriptional regulator, LysR family [plant metagenome]
MAGVDAMKSRAKGMAAGLEPELSVVVDVFFPIEALAVVAREFREQFPAVPLRVHVEALGATFQPVLDRQASVGIVGFVPLTPPGIITEPLVNIAFAMVAAADHPLAARNDVISHSDLAEHVQLVLTDRSELSKGRDFGVFSPKTWKLADLFAKRAFLLNGLGWGGMPLHTVQSDLDSGRLVRLHIEEEPVGGVSMLMSAVYRVDAPPGPAGRWLIERIMACSKHRQHV